MTLWEDKNLYERFVDNRQVEMQRDKDLFKDVQSEVVEYLRPDLTGNTDTDTGKQMGSSIVEGTAHFDAATMATWFVGNLVGPTMDWIRYRMKDRRFKGDDNFNAFLQRMAEFMLEEVYPYPYSNFYEVNQHFVLDGLTIGSPVMLVDEDKENSRKVCTIPHYTENFLMRDYFGSDIAYHRKFDLTNLSAIQAFGKDNLPESIQKECNNGNYTVKHKYLMCIARAGDYIFQNLRPEHQIPLLRPWILLWFSTSGLTTDEKRPLNWNFIKNPDNSVSSLPNSSPGFWHKPFHSWHYHRLPHETYSRTPAWSALPDVKGLNAAWTTIHDVAHQFARPSTIALESLKGKLRLGAEGITWVDEQQYDRSPKPYENRANYSWAMDFVDRRAKSVGRHFFSDMARMIENYSREHKQPPTAFQLAQMISETLVLIGPAITSYAGPALQNIDDQFIEIETRPRFGNDVTTSRLWRETQPPDEIFESNGMIQTVFTGPLMQGLKYAMLAKRIEQPLMAIAPIVQIWPESKYKIRAADVVEQLLEGGDFPQDSIVGKEEYEQIVAAIQEETRQREALERMSIMADMMPKMQGETVEKSPLKAISEAA